jgi:hypothetical protein
MVLLLAWALLRGNSLVIVTRARLPHLCGVLILAYCFFSFLFSSFFFFFWVIGRLSVLFRIDSPIATHLMKLLV